MPEPRLRQREQSDLEACVELLWEVHRADGYPAHWPADPAAWLSPSRLEAAWVAVGTDGAVLGHVALFTLARHPMRDICVDATGLPEQKLAVLSRLLVAPAGRGAGMGTALIHAVVARAHSEGRRPVLDVGQYNTAAIELYERLGWRRIGQLATEPGRDIPVFVYVGPRVPDRIS